MKLLFLPVALLAFTTLTAAAGDWPRFRGPNGTGVAADAKPPTTWSDTQNLKWKLPLPGPGSSSPIIVGDRVFVTCYTGYGDGSAGASPEKLARSILCVNRSTGKVLWEKSTAAEVPEDPYSGFKIGRAHV